MVMSASTFSITTCLPLAIASSANCVPMLGLPVASITTSTRPERARCVGARGDGDQALLDGAHRWRRAFRHRWCGLREARDGRGGLRLRRAHFGDGAEAQARHAGQLHHDVGAHLAAAGKSDGDGSPRFSAGVQFGDERGDACDHAYLLPFFRAADRGIPSVRRGGREPVTDGASPFFNSPGCLP